MRKLPALHLYIGDLLKDPCFRLCTWQAQNLWIRILLHLHEMPHRGLFVMSDGMTALSDEQIAKILEMPIAEFLELKKQILENGVASLHNGAMANRRMLRESEISEKKSKAGKMGGERRWHPDGKAERQESKEGMARNSAYSSSLSVSSSSSVSLKKEDVKKESAQASLSPSPPKVKKLASDEAFLADLRKEELYRGIDLDLQLQLCTRHFKPLPISQKRFINWLAIEVRNLRRRLLSSGDMVAKPKCTARVKREGFIHLQPCGAPQADQPGVQKKRAICEQHLSEEQLRLKPKGLQPLPLGEGS